MMKKAIVILLIYLFLFTIMFALGVYDYFRHLDILNLGFSGIVLIIFSVLGIIKTLWHIHSY